MRTRSISAEPTTTVCGKAEPTAVGLTCARTGEAAAPMTTKTGIAQQSPKNGSEGSLRHNDYMTETTAASNAFATGGVDQSTPGSTAMERTACGPISEVSVSISREEAMSFARNTSTQKGMLRPILIRSLARQKKVLDDGVVTRTDIHPRPTAMTAATNNRRIRVVLETSVPLAPNIGAAVTKAATIEPDDQEARRKLISMRDALSVATEPLLDSPSTGASKLRLFHGNRRTGSNDCAWCGPRRCRWIGRLLQCYSDGLESQPLVLKCVTSAAMGGLGDVSAQAASCAIRGGRHTLWHDKAAVVQTLAVVIDGFCISAPTLHFAYNALDRYLPAQESTAYALAQVALDVFVLNPVCALMFIVTTGLLEGKSLGVEIAAAIREDYITLVLWLMAIGVVTAPLHVYLFRTFSVKWRVFFSDAMDVLWTFMACFVLEPK